MYLHLSLHDLLTPRGEASDEPWNPVTHQSDDPLPITVS